MTKKAIHRSIKEALGYDPETSDSIFLKDWKARSTQVCKPCWELKYCPYGPFVEQSPLLPSLRKETIEHNKYLQNCLDTNMVGTAEPLSAERESSIQKLIALAENDFAGFVEFSLTQFFNQLEFDEASKAGKNMVDVWAQPLPGIEKYEVPFSLREDKKKKLTLKDFHPDMIAFANQLLDKYRTSLDTRVDDGRHPLEPARRLAFESMLAESNPENDPEFIPPEVADLQCNIFGHICPVVFVGEALTETSEERRRGRYISFTVKMRVVRRDNHTCQVCSKHLRDDEVEFDHIIPVAKGGSSEEHNIRLTCFDCNREKSDNIEVCAVQH